MYSSLGMEDVVPIPKVASRTLVCHTLPVQKRPSDDREYHIVMLETE